MSFLPQPAKRHSLTAWTKHLSRRTATGPWFDPIALFALKRWMFPLSRMWAAANVADGDVARFLEAVPISDLKLDQARIRDALALTDETRTVAIATDAEWDRVFFGDAAETSNAQRDLMERARRGRRHAFYATRRHFRFLRTSDIPLAKQQVITPDDAAAQYGDLITGKVQLAPVPDPMPDIEVSRTISRAKVTEHWLRFASPSPVMNDSVLAHVYTPVGVANPPTLIFGHGICVEPEHWRGLLDEVATLVAGGVRVIRPEAPWHGYRTPNGYYGGERLIEVFPSAPIDAFAAALQEWSVLADWAKRTSSGPLAFGGTSLGALMAQRAADESRHWPARLAPDALFLVTHSGNLFQAIMEGDLTRLWGDPEIAHAHGWDEALATQYFDRLNPGPYTRVPGKNIVSVLGSRDRVTPFTSGKALIDRWAVPEANRFIWWRGHFSIPVTLVHQSQPVHRFCEIMRQL